MKAQRADISLPSMLTQLSKARFNTGVARKTLMAVTGLALSLYLVGHLAGNLQLLWNQPQFDAYAHFLTVNMAPVVWVMRAGLLAIVTVHIVDAIVLLRGNYKARPIAYHTKTWARTKSKKSKKSWASTLMGWSGAVILFFIVFHIWHFTMKNPVASTSPGYDANNHYRLADLVINEFSNPFVVAIYVGSMLLLGMHLWHAIASAIRSVGASNPRYQKLIGWFGYGFTIVIVGGFIVIPLAILTGLVRPLSGA